MLNEPPMPKKIPILHTEEGEGQSGAKNIDLTKGKVDEKGNEKKVM